jgi:hypothetical protein
MKLATWIFSLSIVALLTKILLVIAFGYYFSDEAQGGANPNDIITPLINAITVIAVILMLGAIVAFFKKQRGWQLYASIPIILLAFGIAPMVYVI